MLLPKHLRRFSHILHNLHAKGTSLLTGAARNIRPHDAAEPHSAPAQSQAAFPALLQD